MSGKGKMGLEIEIREGGGQDYNTQVENHRFCSKCEEKLLDVLH